MPIGLKDVAERAGVSFKTVSNVVNGRAVRPATRERVQRAIDELGYRPNASARSLRLGRSGVIALALPELSSPYFAELGQCVIAAAEAKGWTVLVDETHGARERELEVLRGIRSQLIDGAIFSPLALGREEPGPLNLRIPLVLLGERLFAGQVDHVAFDNIAAARTAVQHLLDRGRQRIAAVGAQTSQTGETARLRLTGWRAALTGAGRDPDARLVVSADAWHRADGYRAARDVLGRGVRPDALFCFNDLLAVGAMRALAEAGVRVPDDVAVIGIDDIEEGRFATPSLTTISPDKLAIAEHSVDLLDKRLTERPGEPGRARVLEQQDIETGFELVVREST